MDNNLILEEVKDKTLPFIKKTLRENFLVYEDIADEHIKLFLVYKNSALIGIIGLEQFGSVGLLRSLVILEEFRNKGYGKNTCMNLLNYAKDNKIEQIYLLTMTAKKFFEKIGFIVVERENVPIEIKNTGEFSHFCPSSALCMKIDL